jgi:hypothetical protein
VEWYANGPLGLEQGSTLGSRPAPPRKGPLTVELGLYGNLSPALERGRHAVRLRGAGTSLRYTGLVASDAAGRTLRSWLELRGRRLLVRVDDRGARYPLRIDPFVQQAKLTASDGAALDFLGTSVAISGDTVVVGAGFANVGTNADQGAAFVFVKPGSGWANATETAKLTASDGAAGDHLGTSVAASGDTVVAGAPFADAGANSNQGAAYVFVKPGSGWANAAETAKLTASDGAAFADLGFSVAVSGDTVAAGAPGVASVSASPNVGAAYVFVKPESGWANASETAKLTASDGCCGSELGRSVAIWGDTVVVGAPRLPLGRGAAYVFVKPGSGGWANATETAELFASDPVASAQLGTSVAVSGDTVVAGAPGASVGTNTDQGAAYVFVKPGLGWAPFAIETAKLTTSDGATGDHVGFSVAASGDTVVAGARDADVGTNPDQGAAYVFAKPGSGWATATETAKLTASDGAAGDELGFSVALAGDTAVATAPEADVGTNADQGAAYVFGSPPFTDHLLQPLSESTDPANPVINTGKNGRVIPVKVQISQGGTAITDANAPGPVTIAVSKLASCSTTAGTDPITSYADAGQSSAGTNRFQYDAVAQAWVYNLDTKALGLITGNCYRIDVSVNGTPITNPFAVYKPTK